MNCKWDREAEAYMVDGEECKRDDYGDPTHHCKARKTCSQHVGPGDLTCARCLGRTRTNLKRLVDLAALYLPAAVEAGRVDREATSLAGPTAYYGTWEWRHNKRKDEILSAYPNDETRTLRYLGMLAEEQDDENHPTLLLARWVLAFAEDYGIAAPKQITLSSAVEWLDRILGKVAQDPEQDWPLFAREVRSCVQHVESVLAMRGSTHRGVLCPECVTAGKNAPRLVRLFGHWCEDPDCTKPVHVADDSKDVWRCPGCRAEWDPEQYTKYLTERTSA